MQIKNILLVNSIFSLVSAIGMLIFNDYLQKLFGFDIWYVFPLIAFGLLDFILFIWYVISYKLDNIKWIQSIIIMDFLWVIISTIIIIFNLFEISSSGLFTIGAVAAVVGIMGLLQLKAMKK